MLVPPLEYVGVSNLAKIGDPKVKKGCQISFLLQYPSWLNFSSVLLPSPHPHSHTLTHTITHTFTHTRTHVHSSSPPLVWPRRVPLQGTLATLLSDEGFKPAVYKVMRSAGGKNAAGMVLVEVYSGDRLLGEGAGFTQAAAEASAARAVLLAR